MKQPSELVMFLNHLCVAVLPHAGQTYAEHCVGVHNALASWGFSEEICRAGFAHSFYGTERFSGVVPVTRPTVRALIGARAEALAYANCALRREELDAAVPFLDGRFAFRSRFDGADVVVGQPDLVALCAIHLADWLDQVPLTGEWSYRRAQYEALALWLGSPPLAAFRWVYRKYL